MQPNPYQSPMDSAILAHEQHDPLPPGIAQLKTLLRALIVAEFVLGVLSVVVYQFTQATLPLPLREYLEMEAAEPISPWDIVVFAFGMLLLILVLVGNIGLFFFWRPARLVNLITAVLGVFVSGLLGPDVQTGWDSTLEEIATIISGVILALVYFSPLQVLFAARRAGV